MHHCNYSDLWSDLDSVGIDYAYVEFLRGRIGNPKTHGMEWAPLMSDRKRVLDVIGLCDRVGEGRKESFLWEVNLATFMSLEMAKIRNQVKRETLNQVDVEFNDDGGFDLYLEMFVLYDNAIDHPGHFVVRKWQVFKWQTPRPCDEIVLKFEAENQIKAIEHVNNHFKNTKAFLQRSETDDECVVGTWI